MKKMRRIVSLVLLACMIASVLSGCGSKKYKALDASQSGEIDIMLWSGDGMYYTDLGHQNWAPEDIAGQNVASVYAMAKKFNETYPNIKINLYAKSGDPDANDTSWAQEIENFKAEHGKYPDIWASRKLGEDIGKGLVADLSVFSNDPVYQSFNKSIMEMMNYYGFQAGLPQFIQPWGVYVNTGLAEQNNINVPDPDWTIEEFTTFISKGDKENFWGSMDIPMSFINTGTSTINAQLVNRKAGEPYVDLNSDEVKDLLSLVPIWAKNTIWTQNDVGGVPAEVMDANGWWSFNFFINQKVLVNDGDPWMMGDAANPAEGHWGAVKSDEWDIYPRPATDYKGNTVGVVLDPMAVHNFAMDDGDPALSEEEENKLKIAYTFATFWAGSTESMQARADQLWSDNGTLKTALNDSLPLVTGDAFDEQMKVWYSVDTHKRMGDAAKMPGWQKCVELWEKGELWDISDKAYPMYVTEDGVSKACTYEWTNYYTDEVMSAKRSEDNWLDEIKSKLPEWNELANKRFAQAEEDLKSALKNYYGFTDKDFETK